MAKRLQIAHSEKLFEELVNLYTQPHRFYHNLDHVVDCLNLLEEHFPSHSDFDMISLALWYHDAIYNPQALDNETKSADLAILSLFSGKSPGIKANFLRKLIMATDHKTAPQTEPEQIITDIDLAILAVTPEKYKEYCQKVRKEYNHLTNEEFREGRKKFIGFMLKKPQIYTTGKFHQIFEKQVQNNLSSELMELSV